VRNISGVTLEGPSGTTVLQSLLQQKRSLQREAGHAMESAQRWPQVTTSVKFGAKHPSLRSPGGTSAPRNKTRRNQNVLLRNAGDQTKTFILNYEGGFVVLRFQYFEI